MVTDQTQLFGISVELWTAILTLVIATVAVILTLLQVHWQRRHDHASVRPFLVLSANQSFPPEGVGYLTFGLTLKNAGMGTAIFKRFDVMDDGAKTTLKELGRKVISDISPNAYVWGFDTKRAFALGPGEAQMLADYKVPLEEIKDLQAFEKILGQASLRIVYTSIHEEKDFILDHTGDDLKERL